MSKLLVLILGLVTAAAGVYIYTTGKFLTTGRSTPISISKKNLENKETTVEVFAENLSVPWSLEFTSDNRMLVAQRDGRVRVIENGKLLDKDLHQFSEVKMEGEAGLMGMIKSPDYAKNNFLYFCMAYERDGNLTNKIVRAVDGGSSLADVKDFINPIPSAQFHAGCRLRFGPDKKLYVTTGDVTERGLAQDKNSLAGKVLRYDEDGSIPSDNPFDGSPVFSLGHRNPQGIDWHPETGVLYMTEHGPSGFDGPGGGDEINKIEKGKNYGWPVVSHERSRPGLVDPLFVMTPAEAPASGMFYRGAMFPEWKNNFFFGALRGEGLMRAILDESGNVKEVEKMFHEEYGRIRDVVEGPDGSLYFSTSNRDGRGDIQDGDDKIIRIYKK